MSESKGEKKGCKKQRRSSHDVRRQRSHKVKGSAGGRDRFAYMSRYERLLARALDALPNGRILDRMADQGLHWDSHTHKFLREKRFV